MNSIACFPFTLKNVGACKIVRTCCKISSEKLPELFLLVDSVHEDLLVGVLEGKVECLGGKVPDDVDNISSPEAEESLFPVHTGEAVDDAFVPLLLGDELLRVLDLQQDLDTLQWRHHSFRHGGCRE